MTVMVGESRDGNIDIRRWLSAVIAQMELLNVIAIRLFQVLKSESNVMDVCGFSTDDKHDVLT